MNKIGDIEIFQDKFWIKSPNLVDIKKDDWKTFC